MRKLTAILIATLLLSLSACGEVNSDYINSNNINSNNKINDINTNVFAESDDNHALGLPYRTYSNGSSIYIIKPDGSLWVQPRSNYYGGIPRDKIMDNVQSVVSGGSAVYAIKTDGSLWGWGYHSRGQLGLGEESYSEIAYPPTKIMDEVKSVHTGSGVYAIRTDGSLWGWGGHIELGYIGDGSEGIKWSPVKVMDSVSSITFGIGCAMAIKDDGSLWTWGMNTFGQLGDGTQEDRLSPVKIMDDVQSVAVTDHSGLMSYEEQPYPSANISFAIKTDGSLWAWGVNEGQLGIGEDDDTLAPVKIMDDVKSVYSCVYSYFGRRTQYASTFVIKKDDSLWAFGQNTYHTYDGRTVDGSEPVKVLENVASFWNIRTHLLVIDNDGNVWESSSSYDSKQMITEHMPFEMTERESFIYISPWRRTLLRADGSLEWDNGSLPPGSVRIAPMNVTVTAITANSESIIGRWKFEDGSSVEFLRDGTVIEQRGSGWFSTELGEWFEDGDGWFTITFSNGESYKWKMYHADDMLTMMPENSRGYWTAVMESS